MKNIERIRKMDSKELMKFLKDSECDKCIYKDKDCGNELCSIGIEQWLNQDVELTFDDIKKEYNEFCSGKVCEMCKYSFKICEYEHIRDNFNIIDGKITRIQK